MKNIPPVKFSFAVGLVISFLFLFITFWIFYVFAWDANAAKDALSTAGSYFGAAATLGAAVIAAYLFNDWRVEKNYDIENQYLSHIVLGLRDIHAELLEMQSCSLKIKETEGKMISYSYYLNRPRLNIQTTINKLEADVEIYSMLMSDNESLVLLNHLKGYCSVFDSQYNQLIHKYYADYIEKLYEHFGNIGKNTPDIKNKSSFERIYVNNEHQILAQQIKNIRVFFYLHKACGIDNNTSINFDDLAACSIEATEELKIFCIKRLRPRD